MTYSLIQESVLYKENKWSSWLDPNVQMLQAWYGCEHAVIFQKNQQEHQVVPFHNLENKMVAIHYTVYKCILPETWNVIRLYQI